MGPVGGVLSVSLNRRRAVFALEGQPEFHALVVSFTNSGR